MARERRIRPHPATAAAAAAQDHAASQDLSVVAETWLRRKALEDPPEWLVLSRQGVRDSLHRTKRPAFTMPTSPTNPPFVKGTLSPKAKAKSTPEQPADFKVDEEVTAAMWDCGNCTLHNYAGSTECAACKYPKDKDLDPAEWNCGAAAAAAEAAAHKQCRCVRPLGLSLIHI